MEWLLELLFGWIPDLLPFYVSAARLEMLYRKGRLVFIPVEILGLPGAQNIRYRAAQSGHVWMAEKKTEFANDHETLPLPTLLNSITFNGKATWSKGRHLRYTLEGNIVEVYCRLHWELLQRVIQDTYASLD